MIKTTELLTLLADTLAADTALGAWCLDNFESRGSIYTGIDQQKPAPLENYPVVAIVDVRQLRGGASPNWEVIIGCGIVQDAVDTVTGPPLRVTYRGIGQAEAFREQVESALLRGRFAKLEFSGSSEPVNNYPLFVSFTAATVSAVRFGRRRG